MNDAVARPSPIDFAAASRRSGLIAILRGVRADEVVAIGRSLVDAGIGMIEVPLNSPDPFASIAALTREMGSDVLVGAGTVLTPDAAEDAVAAGARLLLAPNCDVAVIAAAKRAGVAAMPGVATVTEAFAALAAGADALKLFPARELGMGTIGAWHAVLPPGTQIFAVGGVADADFATFVKAGAAGFGLGSSLYAPRDSAEVVGERARRAVEAWHAAR